MRRESEHELWIAAACLLQTVQSAIKAGDWKVDGARDPTPHIEYLSNCLAGSGGIDLAKVGEVGVWGNK